jgi:hypothetical protein
MTENTRFKDFNVKLAVIQKLMYEDDVLTPRFDVYAFAEHYPARRIDVEAEGYGVIPEVRAYFEALEIPASALRTIERLDQDGGDEIYLQLYPFWDGEDDVFNVRSAEDVALLPNLRVVTLFYDEDDGILEAFRRRGVAAQWL